MGTSVAIDNQLISALAEKISQARKLYGLDSAYVIGLFTSFDWMLSGVEGGEGLKKHLRDRVLECDANKQPQNSQDAGPSSLGAETTLAENSWVKGKVKWFNNDKGYGFISTDGSADVFVHWRDISSWDRNLAQGDEVEFMVTKTAKGFQAINVMKANHEAQANQTEEEESAGYAAQETESAERPELSASESLASEPSSSSQESQETI